MKNANSFIKSVNFILNKGFGQKRLGVGAKLWQLSRDVLLDKHLSVNGWSTYIQEE